MKIEIFDDDWRQLVGRTVEVISLDELENLLEQASFIPFNELRSRYKVCDYCKRMKGNYYKSCVHCGADLSGCYEFVGISHAYALFVRREK